MGWNRHSKRWLARSKHAWQRSRRRGQTNLRRRSAGPHVWRAVVVVASDFNSFPRILSVGSAVDTTGLQAGCSSVWYRLEGATRRTGALAPGHVLNEDDLAGD